MAGRPTRKEYSQRMASLAREHERKAIEKASSENRFAGEQARLREAFLARQVATR